MTRGFPVSTTDKSKAEVWSMQLDTHVLEVSMLALV